MADLFSNEATQESYEGVLTAILFGLSSLLVPYIALFGLGGAENIVNLDKVNFYSGSAGFALVVILAMTFWEVSARLNKERFRKSGWIGAILHDPDKSLIGLYVPTIAKKMSITTVIFVSFLIFSILGLYSVTQNTFYTGVPQFVLPAQQITTTSELLLAAEPAAGSETLIATIPASLLIMWVYWKLKLGQIDKTTATLYLLTVVIPAIVGFWTLLHLAVYGANDTQILGTAFFGFVGAISYVVFGTFIPWYIFHVINNILFVANNLFADELTIIAMGTVIGIVIILKVLFSLSSMKNGTAVSA